MLGSTWVEEIEVRKHCDYTSVTNAFKIKVHIFKNHTERDEMSSVIHTQHLHGTVIPRALQALLFDIFYAVVGAGVVLLFSAAT